MGKPESLRNNFLMKGTTNTSASQRTQVRWIDGSYLMIYAYKTQDIASCKTLKWYATLRHPKMYPHTKFGNPTSKDIGDMDWTRKRDGRTDGRTDEQCDYYMPPKVPLGA